LRRPIRRASAPLKKLLRLAHNPKVDLWSLDECHFQQHGTRCRMWVPPELKDPVLLHAPTRKSVACFGAVNIRSGALLTQRSAWFNAQTFEMFLKLLLRRRAKGKRMVLILDNARYHHARSLAALLKKYRRVLTLLYLPPYSPQFNPIERVWKLARRLATFRRKNDLHVPDAAQRAPGISCTNVPDLTMLTA
jgi:DDE superfamily endonuclease